MNKNKTIKQTSTPKTHYKAKQTCNPNTAMLNKAKQIRDIQKDQRNMTSFEQCPLDTL